MNRNFIAIILLIFIAGLAAGYTLNAWVSNAPQSIEDEQSANPDSNQNAQEPERGRTQPITAMELYDSILPNTSPAWLSIDCRLLRKNENRFEALWKLPSIQTILEDLSAALPNRATETVEYLYQNAETLDIFLLPPQPNFPTQKFAAAYRVQDVSQASTHPLFHFWKEIIPDTKIIQQELQGHSFHIIQSPFGEMIGLQTGDIVWFSNHTTGFPALFNQPLPPNRKEMSNPRMETVNRYPKAAVAVYMNSAQEGAAAMALPGFIPQMLARFGIRNAVLAYQLEEKGVRLSINAPGKAFPQWIKSWNPLPDFPFTPEDPMGMMELAFHVPVMNASKSVAPIQEINAEESNRNPRPRERNTRERNNRRDRTNAANRSRSETPTVWGYPGMVHLFPPSSVVGLNVFGWLDNQPAVALRIMNTEDKPSWIDRLQNSPRIEGKEIEIGRIPALHYSLANTPLAQSLGRSELVMMERDASYYVFDSPLAGKNYFGEMNSDPAGKNRRSVSIREGLASVESNAQIKGVLTKDWFGQWLVMEIERHRSRPELQTELRQLRDDIRPLLTPVHISAGIRDEEWFLDSYTASASGHLVDMAIFASMAKPFFSNNFK